jgi:transposase
MATLVKLRTLTAGERRELERLARSRTEEARLVVRARIVLGLAAGERPYQVADRVGVGRAAAYIWLHRFNAEGLNGLTDHPRPGRPPTYTADERAEVIAAALTRPADLGLPFGSWTLDRLQAYLSEHTRTVAGRRPTGWTSWSGSRAGCRRASGGCTRSSTTCRPTGPPTCSCSASPTRGGSSCSSPSTRRT